MSDCEKLLSPGSVPSPDQTEASHTLAELVHIIRACNLDPLTQLAGYLMTDDPTYLPEADHARSMADRIGRDKLLETLLAFYLAGNHEPDASNEVTS